MNPVYQGCVLMTKGTRELGPSDPRGSFGKKKKIISTHQNPAFCWFPTAVGRNPSG